ncbi:hypothetical protein AGOR_G00159980 [Albula goreensis]|uniref:Uncharacterized protein n=1 Tax=Albula goreensis TaxID=1534307 RepID=A0A8T3D649_9TELE|nr:hypothetical protein AGOR_G00159980 [Albula goreensis]
MDTVPNFKSLKDYFKQVDYSSWQRSNRKKDVSGHKTETAPLPHPPSLTKVATASPTNKPAKRGNVSTASTTTSKHPLPDLPGLSRPSTSHVESTMSLRDMYTMKKTAIESEPLPPKKDCIKVVKMLIKFRRKAIEDLEEHCKFLQETNRELIEEIENMTKSSYSSVRESLTQHEQLGNSFAALNGWSCRQIRDAQAELRDVQHSADKRLHDLREQLNGVSTDVLKAQAELHTLRTYKDMQYPVKALTIASMETKIESLKEKLQDEHKDVESLCKTHMENLTGQSRQREEEMLAAIAKKHLSYMSPVVQQMASCNSVMRSEIEMFKNTIKEMEETNQELVTDIRELQSSLKNLKKERLKGISRKVDKCSPDMDVILNIPQEECLPI